MQPQRWSAGDPISAGKLNSLTREAVRGRSAEAIGPGSAMVGDNFGSMSSHHQKPQIHLCVATEDFESDIYTDNYLALDKVPSGKCRLVRFNSSNGEYEEETSFEPFRVWDPVSKLNESDSKKEGDFFYAAYNKGNQRIEIIASGGEGGAKIISFAIVSSDPTIRTAQVEIRQRSFSGKVLGSILEDSVVQVYDTDGCYLNEPNVDLTGRLGKAILMLVDTEAQQAHFPANPVPVDPVPTKYWNVISLCCPSIVCEV